MSYSATEAARLSGLTYRQLDHLCRHVPELGQPTGSGTRRSFEAEDLPVLTALRRLRDLGADNEELRRVLWVLVTERRPRRGWIVLTERGARVVTDARPIAHVVSDAESARVVRWDSTVVAHRRRPVA